MQANLLPSMIWYKLRTGGLSGEGVTPQAMAVYQAITDYVNAALGDKYWRIHYSDNFKWLSVRSDDEKAAVAACIPIQKNTFAIARELDWEIENAAL